MTAPATFADITHRLMSGVETPDLIYLAIGCGQAGVPAEYTPYQEYPPQVRDWPGRKLCILIDPHLEEPLRVQPTADATFYPFRQPWLWTGAPDRMFLYSLINFVLRPQSNTRLIVQDYTGVDIRPYYPLDVFPPQELLNRVLFDMTQRDGGCYINFNNVHILQDIHGDFIQTAYVPMSRFAAHAAPLAYEMQQRYLILTHYVHRLYRIQEGLEPPRDWLTVSEVRDRCRRLWVAYRLPTVTTQDGLAALLTQGLNDFALTTHTPLTMAEMDDLIMSGDPRGEPLSEALKMMMATA